MASFLRSDMLQCRHRQRQAPAWNPLDETFLGIHGEPRQHLVLEQQVPTEKTTMSVEDAASTLGIGRSLAYDLARRGELPGVLRLGSKRLRVSRAALERYLQQDQREVN